MSTDQPVDDHQPEPLVDPDRVQAGHIDPLRVDPRDLDPGHSADPVPSSNPSPVPTDRERAAQGGRWGVLSGVIEQGGSMLATIVLAKILTPEDFGVVGAATLVLNLLVMVGNLGWATALIRRRSIDEPVSSTTFWAATSLGAALTVILMVTAPLLARALKQPEITAYVIALAPLLTISMVSNVSEARLLRELRFPWVYTADIANIAAYAAVTLVLAQMGWGAWSMVIGRLVGETLATGIRLVAARWVPKLLFDWSVVREDMSFNRSFFAIQVTNYVTKNIDYWVVSRTLGLAALGVYYVAFVLPTILRQRMTWLATEILLPLMSRVIDDRDQVTALYRESMELLCFVAFPLLVGIALTAEQIIGIAFGPEWYGAVAPLRWLAVAATVEVTAHAGATLFLALDRPKVPSRMMLLRLVLMAITLGIATAAFDGLEAIAAAVAIATALSTLLIHVEVSRTEGIAMPTVARWLAPMAMGTAAMVLTVLGTQALVRSTPLMAEVIAMAAVGAATYLGLMALLDRTLTTRMLRTASRMVRRG